MKYEIESDRIYALNPDGKTIAEVTFPIYDGTAYINHTYVDPSLRGQGIAGQLVKMAADKILADGHRIAAICPYAVDWFSHHPEYPVIK